jgi:polysaccharide export outer membrane protein
LALSSDQVLAPLLAAIRPPIRFAPDDELSVRIFQLPDFLSKQRVPSDGAIVFPLVGRIQVSGLTVEELQSILASRLKDGGFIRDPQVTVVADSRPSAIVTVSGEVNKPGIFPAFGALTLSDYISAAGGLVEIVPGGSAVNAPASSIVTVIRPTLSAPVVVSLGENPALLPYGRLPIFPGDEIRVGKAGMVYAVGALKNQGGFPLKGSSPTTVSQLVALAGGVGYEAASSDARIVRTIDGTERVLTVNVKDILRGKIHDVALVSDDILYIPTNQMKAAIKGGGANLVVSIASAYLYAVH